MNTVANTHFTSLGESSTLTIEAEVADSGLYEYDALGKLRSGFIVDAVTNAFVTLTLNAYNTNRNATWQIDSDAGDDLAGVGIESRLFYSDSTFAKRLDFRPEVVSTGSVSAYLFDTANALTNGDATISIANAGTQYAYFGPGGSPALSVTSLAADNATNVALVVDTAQKWTTGQPILNVKDFGVSGFAVGMNFLTNFWGDYGTLVSIGYPVMDFNLGLGNLNIFNYGDAAGQNQLMTNSYEIFNYGSSAGQNQALEASDSIYNFGPTGSGQALTNFSGVFNFGLSAGASQSVTTGGSLYNYGTSAGSGQILISSGSHFNYGHNAGSGQRLQFSTGTYNNGPSAGTGQIVTNGQNIVNFGYNVGASQHLTNATDVFNFGASAGASQSATDSSDAFNYGFSSGQSQILQASQQIYNSGDESGLGQVVTNGFDIYSYGNKAGFGQTLTNVNDLFNLGGSAAANQSVTSGARVFNDGFGAGEDQTLATVSSIFNFGDAAGFSQIVTNSQQVFNNGFNAGYQQTVWNSTGIFNNGSNAGREQVVDGVFEVVNSGLYAGYQQSLSAGSSNVYNYGFLAGAGLSGVINDTMAFGYRSLPTQSHQIVMGVAPVGSGNIFVVHNGNTNKFLVSNLGAITLAGTTNQVTFGATNTAPASAVAPTKWISVQVSGESGVFRIPLYE